jgi:hypothetical protein
MAFHRRFEDDPLRAQGMEHLEHRLGVAQRVAVGTLACPQCDAPVALSGPVAPADWIGCPFCLHTGATRDFLSLAAPTRPARVEVRIRRR